jgi:tRNA 2-selenouridine synthase
MEKGLDILAFLEYSETLPIIDVRTPSEYMQGHIPSAYNIPLFSDEERKRVGTIYKQKGQREAVVMGLEYAGPKMKKLALQASGIAIDQKLLVHCWRGGMRSASMAWLFKTVGLESMVLEGGYKTFRRHVLSSLDRDFSFVVIGGLTGSGKTDVLLTLKNMGEQVIDLEGMANHKGSAFGSLGEKSQGTNEQFENDIFTALNGLDKNRIIWIEDESRTIGKNTVPGGIYRNIRSAPLIFLDVTPKDRVDRLVRDYAGFSKEDLSTSVQKISPRLGDLTARLAIKGIQEGNYQKTVELVLHYYDKTYRYGLGKREPDLVFNLPLKDDISLPDKAGLILEFVKQNRIFV